MKKMTYIFIFCFIQTCLSQNNDRQAATYNVLLGGIGGGIGAIINKKPEVKVGETFLKGFWQGALGGVLIFGSKKLNIEIAKQQSFAWSWPSKIVNAAGTSIVENAASNRNFYDVWHINFGFNHLEIDTREKIKFRYKVRPISLGIMLGTAINSKFEIGRTFASGHVIFSARASNMPRARAIVIGDVIRIRSNLVFDYDIYSHEIIHIFQKNDLIFANSFLNPYKEEWGANSTFGKVTKYFDIEYEYATNGLLFGYEEIISKETTFDNFLESEAEYYSFPSEN